MFVLIGRFPAAESRDFDVAAPDATQACIGECFDAGLRSAGEPSPGRSPDPPHLNARYDDPKLARLGKTLPRRVF